MGRNSFIIHNDSLAVLSELTDEQAGVLFKAMYQYQKTGEITLDGIMKALFIPFKNQFDRDNEKSRSGIFHWNWRGGVTPENKAIRLSTAIKEWRKSVFLRDNYTCQRCFIKGGVLHAHHIKKFSDFPELRTTISNGLTLCADCHRLEHKKRAS